ncbi:hypothetical protein Tco_0446366 [Tanacetum coccineum]
MNDVINHETLVSPLLASKKKGKTKTQIGLPSTSPKDGIHQCKYLLEGKPIDPQDTEGNLHPIVKGFPATNPDEGFSSFFYARHSKDNWAKHEEVATSYADLRAVVEEYVEENDDHKTQTKKAMNNTIELIEKINKSRFNECTNLLKSLNKVSETLKDDSALKAPCRPWKKPTPLYLATSSCASISESLKEDPEFNQRLLKAAEGYIQNSARLTKISNSLRDFNLQSLQTRITNFENTQVTMQSDITSIKTDTSTMKEMMTEMFNAFKEFSSSTPSGSTCILTVTPLEATATVVEGRILKDKDTHDSPCNLVKATKEVFLDLNALLLINYEINRVMYQLTNEEIQAYLEKQEQIEKVAKEARLFELSKHALIKVGEEVASEAGVDPKALCSSKGGKELLKQQDAEYKVLQREHLEKLKKKRFDQNFMFGDSDVSECDELSDIILKKENKVGTVETEKSRKRKALELEHKVRIAGLECDRSLPEGVKFVNNKVIEIPEHGIFFIDAFGDHPFKG